MSTFDSVIGRIRQSLNPGAAAHPHGGGNGAPAPALQPEPGSGSLQQRFIEALSAVGGVPIEAGDESVAVEKIAELLRSKGVGSAAAGKGITTDSSLLVDRLSREGLIAGGGSEGAPTSLKQRLAALDAGIVEADYAIAATGTLAMIANGERPRSLSLIPPLNVVLLRASRILPDLAAVLRAVGPDRIVRHPLVMVTGPSRTADIEKRIVIGVHGPKELYVVIIGGGSAVIG